ncbi:hypothetical protein D3C87_1850450 [compost metagenome]
MRVPQPKLLIEAEQASSEIQVAALLVALVIKVQDEGLFTVSISVKILVAVVNQNGLGIGLPDAFDAGPCPILGRQLHLSALGFVQLSQVFFEQSLCLGLQNIVFSLRHSRAFGNRLAKGSAILKREAALH